MANSSFTFWNFLEIKYIFDLQLLNLLMQNHGKRGPTYFREDDMIEYVSLKKIPLLIL